MLSRMSPKTVTAAVLLCLMGVMWVRVLIKGGPASAGAAPAEAAAAGTTAAATPVLSIRAVELNCQAGTHDRLHRDPFAAAQARWFCGAPEAAVEIETEETISPEEQQRLMHEQNLKEIAEMLTVEAIMQNADGTRQAFASGKVVTPGSRLKVARNGSIYELTAEEIRETEVIFKWQAFSIPVHMSPSEWMEDGKDGVL